MGNIGEPILNLSGVKGVILEDLLKDGRVEWMIHSGAIGIRDY
jgi:hypothetical protein